MKKLFFIFVFLTVTALSVSASSNYLHTITLEKNNTGYNIILDTDKMVKVSKSSPSPNELILELGGVTSSDTVNALYKGTSAIDNLVVENVSPNKLKLSISAPNIVNSSVIMSLSDGSTAIAGETFPLDKTLWVCFVLIVFGVIFNVSKRISDEDSKILIKQDIKDREIEMYRKYRRDLDNLSIQSMKEMRMKSMLKKIDRKIDERLMSSIK